jgi:uncharacterized cofD-like protein
MITTQIQSIKIVTIGGGSGQFALLAGLRSIQEMDITAIVSMVDSGGSTGRLRDELGILPPGDILKCILALSPHRDVMRSLFLKRFENDRRLKGHTAGNMLLTMLSRYTGSFPAGVNALSEILDTRGTILPVTIDRATLVAELSDGSRIFGEEAIDMPRGTLRKRIKNVYLVPHHADSISVYPPVLDVIEHADYIILGPGDLFTSIVPNLVVPKVKEAIRDAKAKILFVINIMTKFGETDAFTGKQFVKQLEEILERPFDGIVYNSRKPDDSILKSYQAQKARFVDVDLDDSFWTERNIIASDILDTSGGIVRHDSQKLAVLIDRITCEKRL